MKQHVVTVIVLSSIAVVSLFLFFQRIRPTVPSASSYVERKDPTASNTAGERPLEMPPQEAGISRPSLSSPVLPSYPSQKETLHRRAEKARARADMAAAKTEAIFAKLAKYGAALDYSLATLQAEAAYPTGYQPGSDYHIEEARAARVEARAAELEAVLTRQMRQ